MTCLNAGHIRSCFCGVPEHSSAFAKLIEVLTGQDACWLSNGDFGGVLGSHPHIRVSLLFELIGSARFEIRTSDMRGEGDTATPPTQVGRVRTFSSEQAMIGGKHWTRVSLLFELIGSAYPMAMPGFEPRTSDMRGERVTTTPPTHVGRIRIFTFEQEMSNANGLPDHPTVTGSSFDESGTPITLIKCEHVRLFRRDNSDASNVRWWNSGYTLASHDRCPGFESRHGHWICTADKL
ncbi:hypothetical protein T265_10749 [Opisthorchis viverrini]|uniref:Uncharacterized protein n=1 Tax=Opisthorchis viverrini TaxID=6198 RepID=A0A074Z1D3_OPIVI|nr:hypothetical protein T265_10749 [Opisthorchis viverrini]KER20778.1 hypothetical protein T265_10749 [Opisthorchis viverrini]